MPDGGHELTGIRLRNALPFYMYFCAAIAARAQWVNDHENGRATIATVKCELLVFRELSFYG